MKSLRRFFKRLVNLRAGRAQEQRLREEIQDHIAMQTEDNLRAGLSPVEARRQALLKFGGVEAMKEDYRAERGFQFLDTSLRDLRYAIRMLRYSPSFTIAAIVTLAVAIGANAVAFGIMDALILRPLNVPEPRSLYGLQRDSSGTTQLSYPDYVDLRDRNRSFDGLAAYKLQTAGLHTGQDASAISFYEVSGNYFDVLGLQPYLGRFFHASDERGANSAPYVVLTYAFWHAHFHEDYGVVGRTVQINKHPFTIIGVAPPGFRGTLLFFSSDLFLPMVNEEQIEGVNVLNARGNDWVLLSLGHLKTGVTPAQAVADLNAIGADLKKSYPKDEGQFNFSLARPSLSGDWFERPVRAFLTALMLLAGLILLAACANLGSLFAARAADRSREIALRLALGASRTRVLRQLFTEALGISLLGGGAGLWGSVVLLQWLAAWRPFPQFPLNVPVNPDGKVYAAALLLALASGFLFGAAPARQVLRTDPYEIVKSGSLGRAGRRITLRDVMLVVQIAICAVLVTASMVAVRGLARSLFGKFGFEPRNALLMEMDLNTAGYHGAEVLAMQKRLIDAVKTIPGVESAGLVDGAPLTMEYKQANVFNADATDLRPANAAANVVVLKVSPEYFHSAGSSLLAGRDFTWNDDENAPRVAVINPVFAREIFGSMNKAMGGYFEASDGSRVQVVGVVEDGKYTSLTEDPQPAMFLPAQQSPSSITCVVVRANGDPQQLAAALRSKLHDLDAGLPSLLRTWNDAMEIVLFPSRAATVSLGILGMMGAMLSLTGIFGVAAYSISKRRRELGIRIALGAQRKEVLQAALGRALKLLAIGSAAGLFLGILASRVLASIVYQASPRDPLVLAGVVLAMLLLGLFATWIPAQRALSIDPLILLREE